MSEATGKRQKARLFLEGREVPFVSAVISSSIGQPCTAQIELVPLQKIKFIRPRTQVHVFVRDYNSFGDDQFYLAFEGEVIGRSYSKSQNERSARISAIDYSYYWEEAKAYFSNAKFAAGMAGQTASNGEPPPGQVAKALAGKVVPTDTNANSYMIQVLTSQKDASGKVDLAKGVVEVLRRLGTVNEFYRAAYERLRVMDRVRSYNFSKLSSVLNKIKADVFFEAFEGANGGIESIRSLLLQILGSVFHEVTALPFPGKGLNEGKQASLAQFLIMPDSFTIPPPRCNVLFPSQIMGFTFTEDFSTQPTRYSFRPSFVLPAKDGAKTITYSMKFYPTSFSDYMYGKKTVDTTEGQSLLGPSALLKDKKTGASYSNIYYGTKKDKAVGTAMHPVLRQQDFLTNEESLRGIVLAMDTYSPNYTALKNASTSEGRTEFFDAMGRYMFFKKRYGARQCDARIVFNPNIVLGMNALFLDDGDAGQSFIAKVQSITHYLTNQGFSTQLGIGYGRDFDEVDMMTGKLGDPPVPPWLDPEVFGKDSAADFKAETEFLKGRGLLTDEERDFRTRLLTPEQAKNGRPARGPQTPLSYKNTSKYYKHLIGSQSVTGFIESTNADGTKTTIALATTRGAVTYLVDQFKRASKRPGGREEFVRKYTKRLFVSMPEAFSYLGASTNAFNGKNQPIIPEENAMFFADNSIKGALAGRFDGAGFSDENILKVRREIIDAYIDLLRSRRNFRG